MAGPPPQAEPKSVRTRLGLVRYRANRLGDALHPRRSLWPCKSQGIQISARYGGRATPVGGIHSDSGSASRRSSRRNPEARTAFLGYRELLALLPVYEGYANQDDGERLPTITKTVRPGQTYAGVARLGRFLQIIGDIPAGAQLNPNASIYD